MKFKKSLRISFVVMLCSAFNFVSLGQVGYAVFGNGGMCNGTGLCTAVQNGNLAALPVTYNNIVPTFVYLNYAGIANGNLTAVSMTILMSELKICQPDQYNNFSTGSYQFGGDPVAKIPSIVFGGVFYQTYPNGYVTIPTGINYSVPFIVGQNPFFVTIQLGNLPITPGAGPKNPKPSHHYRR